MQARALRRTSLTAAAMLAIAGFTGEVLADDSMRCGNRIISTGDSKDKVRTLCGEPTSVTLAGVARTGRYGWGYGSYDYSYFGPGWVEVPVEIWTYNLGPNKLLRKLRFFGDELDDIRTEGYGY